VTRLLDRLDDGLDVHWFYGAQVEDFNFDAVLLLEFLGGDEGLADAAGEGDDGKVFAGALDLGFSELGMLLVRWGREWMRGSYGNDEIVFLGCFAHGEGETV